MFVCALLMSCGTASAAKEVTVNHLRAVSYKVEINSLPCLCFSGGASINKGRYDSAAPYKSRHNLRVEQLNSVTVKVLHFCKLWSASLVSSMQCVSADSSQVHVVAGEDPSCPELSRVVRP